MSLALRIRMKYEPLQMEDIVELRKKIDQIDQELLKLLQRRFQLVSLVKEFKKANDWPVIDEARRAEVLKLFVTRARDLGVSMNFAESLFNLIHSESVRLQC